ncbi:MAG TPA: FAD-binding oxidoreductase, partial [Herminiimonas sp.]|nr:FAD-binding oxidoreductase [Herminiimonas sp.]
MSEFLDACRSIVGASHVLTEAVDTSPYLIDRRRRYTGKALAVIRPASTQEVAAIVRLCNIFLIPIVPQGGNTGLVLGSVPDDSGTAIVLSLGRMNRILAVDAVNNTITVEAGCILEQVQNAAATAERLFPLSLAAEGTCTIGGNL